MARDASPTMTPGPTCPAGPGATHMAPDGSLGHHCPACGAVTGLTVEDGIILEHPRLGG